MQLELEEGALPSITWLTYVQSTDTRQEVGGDFTHTPHDYPMVRAREVWSLALPWKDLSIPAGLYLKPTCRRMTHVDPLPSSL